MEGGSDEDKDNQEGAAIMVGSRNASALEEASRRPAPSAAQQRRTGRAILTDSEDNNDI